MGKEFFFFLDAAGNFVTLQQPEWIYLMSTSLDSCDWSTRKSGSSSLFLCNERLVVMGPFGRHPER
jgi:hypothetical protein